MVEPSNNRANTRDSALGRPLGGAILEQMKNVGIANIIPGAAVDGWQDAGLDPAAQAALAHVVALRDQAGVDLGDGASFDGAGANGVHRCYSFQ